MTSSSVSDGAVSNSVQMTSPDPKAAPRASKKALIVGTFYQYQGAATNAQIAQATGTNEGYVSRVLRGIRDRSKAMNRGDSPRGYKSSDGEFDAWEA